MAATNYTPIQLYHSTTASAVPVNTNLVDGELAINITDGKLYYKDNGGTVRVIATKATGTIGGSDTQVQYNSSGALAGSSNFTFNGTTATINTLNLTNALGATYGGTAQSSWTTGDLLYASGSNTLAKLGVGLNTYILTSNGTIPGWSAPSAISVSTATNLAGGAGGSVPYQSGSGTTTFLSIGTANQVVTSTGSAPQWSSGLSITTLTASDAITFSATTQNIALGTSQTSGTWTAGGTAQTGNIVLDRSTKTHTLSIGAGITESGQTKTINIGTAGDTGSTTAIAIGSTNGTTITLNGTVNATTVNVTTLDLTNIEVTNIKAKDGTASITLADSTGIATFSKATVIETTDNTNAALRVTQLGTGLALLVEDSANPDATPFVVTAGGDVGIGTSSPSGFLANKLVVATGGTANEGITIYSSSNNGSLWFADATTGTGRYAGGIDYQHSTNELIFYSNTQGNMRLNASGGLIVTPAATGHAVFNEDGVDADFRVEGDTDTHLIFAQASTDRVGIGTNQPGAKLHVQVSALSGYPGVANAGALIERGNGPAALNIASPNTENGIIWFADQDSASVGNIRYEHSSNTLSFRTNGSDCFYIDSSGNLGLGVTPSAWGSNWKALDEAAVGCLAATGAGSGDYGPVFNAYNDNTNWLYKYTGGASMRYRLNESGHAWYTAPSGTAGSINATSLTSAENGNSYTILVAGTTDFTAIGAANNNVGTTFTKSGGTGTGTGTVTQNIQFVQAMTLTAAGGLVVGGTADPGASNISAFGDFRLNSASYSRVADLDSAGGFGGGYNFYIDTATAKYDSTGAISGYHYKSDGVIAFYTGTSAAAGTTAPERARITAGGNLLVGATSQIASSGQAPQVLQLEGGTGGTASGVAIRSFSNNAFASNLDFFKSRGTGSTNTIVQNGDTIGKVWWSGADGTNYIPAGAIFCEVDGTPGTNDMPGRLVFYTTADGSATVTERARITSSGYFKASNTGTYQSSTSTYHELRNDANANTVRISNTIASGYTDAIAQITFTGYAPNTTTSWFLFCNDSTATRAEIRSNGGLANYQSNNVDLSDIRTKTDINPLGSYWNKIAGLEIVTYKYKDQTHDDLNIGVIAQQVEQIAPEFVDPDGFGNTPEDGVPLKTIYNKDLTFAAIKALQEAMTRIEQLEAKVAALEGK